MVPAMTQQPQLGGAAIVATVGRAGPLLRAEFAPAARLAIALDVGADAVMAPVRGPVSEVVELSTAVVPYAGVELVLYAF